MNSPSEREPEDYNYLAPVKIEENTDNNSDIALSKDSVNQETCEICNEVFSSKKELRSHIIIHLGEPRVLLKRWSGLVKAPKRKEKDTYWLDPETKGSLKFTLKKQQLCSGEALKLKLKKSSKSEDFTVVSGANLDLDSSEDDHLASELAESDDNVQMDDKSREEETQEESPYENVIVNEAEAYGNEEEEEEQGDEEEEEEENNYDDEEISNPLEDNEIASLEANEGDSGVGSDMANPSEREDQSVDDLHGSGERAYDRDAVSATKENEDPEDADALEATCRETIENLKKLGEHSSSRSLGVIGMLGRSENAEVSMEPLRVSQDADDSPSFGIRGGLGKSSSRADTERGTPENESNFGWSDLSSTAMSRKVGEARRRGEEESEEAEKDEEIDDGVEELAGINGNTEGNLENAGSLLQNFLLEHHRRTSERAHGVNSLTPVETEYVSLEKLAETVSTCRVCNEKFRNIAQLDEHRTTSGHFQCNFSECSSLVFATQVELSVHKSQHHGAPTTRASPQVSRNSPRERTSPHVGRRNSPAGASLGSPNTGNPAGMSLGSPNTVANQAGMSLGSPNTGNRTGNVYSPLASSPHSTNSPTYGLPHNPGTIPPVNFDQLPAPVQQLAQQVQRMPLPQLPPGANTMIPGPNYYGPPPGRPYRIPGGPPQNIHYPPHIAHLYSQYPGPPPYPQMPGPHPPPPPPPVNMQHPQMSQQMSRPRYPQHMQNPRAPRIPQMVSAPRQRLKRPLQPVQHPSQQQRLPDPANKQRRMDVLLPDRNEDADCHVIVQQKRNDGLPVIQNVQGASIQQTNRSDSTIHLTDSITLSVRQPAGTNPAQTQSPASGTKKPDAKAVANVLAARGITVTPAASKNKSSEASNQSQSQPERQGQSRQSGPSAAPASVNVAALNLNSAISIIPASSQRKQQETQQQQQPQPQQQQQQQQFAVPQNKHSAPSKPSSDVERPPRPPTVDLTQDVPQPSQVVRRGRPPRALLTCQVCDKSFQNQEMLSQHMASHRTTSKLLHKCNLCPAQYPTGQALAMHKQTYHKEVDAFSPNGGIELALPVVDLKSPQVLNRLSSLGIQSYIPLSQLSAQTGGYFGLPIITIDGARNANSCNLGALGATSILSLGPLKHLSNR